MSGELDYSPARILAELLIDLGKATRVSASGSWPVYVSLLPNSPDEALAVVNTTGIKDGRSLVTGTVYEHYGFQILGRSADDNSICTKMNSVATALDTRVDRTYVSIGSNTFRVQGVTRTSPILYAGFDGTSKRRMYSVNGLAAICQMAGTGSY